MEELYLEDVLAAAPHGLSAVTATVVRRFAELAADDVNHVFARTWCSGDDLQKLKLARARMQTVVRVVNDCLAPRGLR